MREYYERRAGEYDATAYAALDHAEVAQLTAFVAGLTPGRTLDVACGTGYLTRFLRGDIVAVDQSAAMLDVARGRLLGAAKGSQRQAKRTAEGPQRSGGTRRALGSA